MRVHLYTHNKYTQHTQIHYANKNFYLDMINHLTALIILYYIILYIIYYIILYYIILYYIILYNIPKITGLNDYRPVALTSVVMKSFERLVLAHLKDITGPLLDPLQFAYRANRSVDDAVNMGIALHPPTSRQRQGSCLWTSAPLSTPSSWTPFRINWHSSPSPPPSVSGSPASWQTGSS